MKEPPVFYFTRMVLGYRVPVLRRLNERLQGRLVVVSGRPPGSSTLKYLEHGEDPGFRHVVLPDRWIGGDRVHFLSFRDAFRRIGVPSVVLAEESPRSVSLPFLLRHARRLGSGRVLWGHFSSLNRRFDPRHHVRDRYRLMLARRVEACACYTDGVADMLRPFVPSERLFVARNTIDMEPLVRQYDGLAPEGRDSVRRRLGMDRDEAVLFFMGRLVPEKGTTLLLETFDLLRRDRPATLVVVGDGPERESMEAWCAARSLDRVRFLGALSDEEAAPYLFASDVALMPGYLGLIINHAFAFGLPVVSRADPDGVLFHSPEVEYVRNGENGILSAGNGPDDLLGAVRAVLVDRERFSANARTFALEKLGLDRMIDGLVGAIDYADAHRPA